MDVELIPLTPAGHRLVALAEDHARDCLTRAAQHDQEASGPVESIEALRGSGERLFRPSGFADEAEQMGRGAGGAALSDRLLDGVCLVGPMARCREQPAAFRRAGVDLPILVPPIGMDGARSVIRTFRR